MPEELERSSHVLSKATGVVNHHRNLVGAEIVRMLRAQSPTVLGTHIGRLICKGILHILGHRRPRIRGTVATLAEPGGLQANVHCSSGKGLTGPSSSQRCWDSRVSRPRPSPRTTRADRRGQVVFPQPEAPITRSRLWRWHVWGSTSTPAVLRARCTTRLSCSTADLAVLGSTCEMSA